MPEHIEVHTATATRDEAERIGDAVVADRLAACAQVVGPVRSTYWWQGQIETAEEWLCVMKSDTLLFDALQQRIRELHSYATPQITAFPITAGSEAYLRWLRKELRH